MDKYSIPEFLKRIMDLPFNEFKKAIIIENEFAYKEYLKPRTKDADKLFAIESYHRNLECLVAFIINEEMKRIPHLGKLSTIKIIQPAIESYVQKGELPQSILQVFNTSTK